MIKSYHQKWSRRKRRPVGDIELSQARNTYTTGGSFCIALWSDSNTPIGYIESGAGGVGVGFLDDARRVSLEYGFQKKDNRLFLGQAFQYEYAGDEYPAFKATCYFFTFPDGVRIESSVGGRVEFVTKQANLEDNWEPIPTFDELHYLSRRERQLVLPPRSDC